MYLTWVGSVDVQYVGRECVCWSKMTKTVPSFSLSLNVRIYRCKMFLLICSEKQDTSLRGFKRNIEIIIIIRDLK